MKKQLLNFKYVVIPLALFMAVGVSLASADSINKQERPNRGHAFFSELTDAQKETLQEMREDKASREDIHAQLEDWGIELPERGERPEGKFSEDREPPFFSELTDAQKETLQEMREDEVSREDIHAQLEDWGIELPERGERPNKINNIS